MIRVARGIVQSSSYLYFLYISMGRQFCFNLLDQTRAECGQSVIKVLENFRIDLSVNPGTWLGIIRHAWLFACVVSAVLQGATDCGRHEQRGPGCFYTDRSWNSAL